MIVFAIQGEGLQVDTRLSLLFSPSRREKIARLKTAEGKAQSACAEMAYMLACLRGLGEVPPYRYGDNGKPEMTLPARGFFSLSHAGPYGLCAWSRQPVGADIESATRNLTRLSRRLLAPEDEIDDFNLLWCVKESYVKLTGEGLSHSLPSLIVKGDTLRDPRGRVLAHFRCDRLSSFLWSVCAPKPEPVQFEFMPAAQAEKELLRHFTP